MASDTPTPVFSGHETFPFRYGWLKKGIDAILERPDIFQAEDGTTYLGVGKNMVRSIRHWCLATGLIEEVEIPGRRDKPLRVSELGLSLVGEGGFDPYLEDSATLWLLHRQLAAKPGRAHTWYWTFNEYRKRQFTRAELRNEIFSLVQATPGSRASKNTVKRDVDCFVRSYVPSRSQKATVLEDTLDCPLVELGLLDELADNETLAFNTEERSTLPDSLFAYCLVLFWNDSSPEQNTLSFEALAYLPGGPGKVFQMSDRELLARLEQLEALTDGGLSFDETAGLKQVYRRRAVNARELLDRVYRRDLAVVGRS